MQFQKANMPVAVAAKALQMDCQTVRILLQNNLVSWGSAYKRPGSMRYSYLISPLKFHQETGYIWKEGVEDIGAELEGRWET